ncbi:MAG: hypothetical protein HYS27_17835 [Deltaproteobacteria bacterium]|nr:hypothetical protein [Deltaproteobacteria bacterium]
MSHVDSTTHGPTTPTAPAVPAVGDCAQPGDPSGRRGLSTILNWFLARDAKRLSTASPIEIAQGHLVAGLLLVWTFVAAFFACYIAATGGSAVLVLVAVAGVLLWGSGLCYLRYSGDVRRVGALLCVGLALLVGGGAFADAGALTLMGPWGLVTPLLATFVLGIRTGVAFGVAMLLLAMLATLLQFAGVWTPDADALAWAVRPDQSVISGGFAMATALAIGGLYDSAQRRARDALAAAVHRLEATKSALVQAEKLSAVGQLAGGVAHEINNPLGVILGFAQGLERRVPEGDPLRLPVASIAREALRCRNLVQELLTFSRVAKRTSELLDLNELVRATAVLLEARAKTQGVRVALELDEGRPMLRANMTQLQQILVNLGTNAMDAMPAGGTLSVRTRRARDAFGVVEVEDTGTGIAEDVRARMFEPFFTTKEVGKGTGLGLSLVYEIVQQHQGRLRVDSVVGKGTLFSIELPTSRIAAVESPS